MVISVLHACNHASNIKSCIICNMVGKSQKRNGQSQAMVCCVTILHYDSIFS